MFQFEGKILCLVNVASACGYTKSNYEQLSQLYDEFPDKVEVLAFPCNQFGAQEPVRIRSSPWQHIHRIGGMRVSHYDQSSPVSSCLQGTHDEICEFVASKPTFNGADKKFVFFEKADVNGPNAREVYTFLKSRLGGAEIGRASCRERVYGLV